MRLLKDKKARAGIGIVAIFLTAMIVAVCSVIGLAMVATSNEVFDLMGYNETSDINVAMDNVVSTITSSWTLVGLIVLAMFGAAAIGAFAMFRT